MKGRPAAAPTRAFSRRDAALLAGVTDAVRPEAPADAISVTKAQPFSVSLAVPATRVLTRRIRAADTDATGTVAFATAETR